MIPLRVVWSCLSLEILRLWLLLLRRERLPSAQPHAGGVLVLNHIAPIHNTGNSLMDECLGAGQDLSIRRLAASANKDRNASSGFDNFVVERAKEPNFDSLLH
jgi:hypothetical protein